MLGICARDHNTWFGRPLKIACNGRADAYYNAVRKSQSAYDAAQNAARPSTTVMTRGTIPAKVTPPPNTATPLGETLPTRDTTIAANGDECYQVDAKQGWQYFNLLRPRSRVASITGSWSVDTRNYSSVGAEGHTGEAGQKLEPYGEYKYVQSMPSGALLVDIPTEGYGYIPVSQAMNLPRSVIKTAMRINDGDNTLGDNAGSLQVCFGS